MRTPKHMAENRFVVAAHLALLVGTCVGGVVGVLGAVGLAPAPAAAAEVNQVLVLYNRNWTADAPGTDAGQDSQEVARHYVARHTDARTGKKPHLLGLDIRNVGPDKRGPAEEGILLHDAIAEESHDNPFGVEYRGRGKPLPAKPVRGAQPFYLLSTHVACCLAAGKVDWDSVTLKVGSADDPAAAKSFYSRGASAKQPAMDVTDLVPGPGKRFETSAERLGLKGELHVWVQVKAKSGQALRDERLDYPDFSRIEVPVSDTRLDWRTLAVDVWSPANPTRRLRMCGEGKSRIPEYLKIAPGAKGSPGRLTLNAADLGLRGDFVLGWSGRDGDGRDITGPETLLRDSQLVRVDIPDTRQAVDWSSARIRYSELADASMAQPLYERGAARQSYDVVRIQEGTDVAGKRLAGTKVLAMDAYKAGFRGDVYVWVSAKDPAGKTILDRKARYFDAADLVVSRTGPDGIRDDQNYLDIIEKPVKAFLEDPANAVDGQLLKDRILYIVICHGMPMVVRRTYGLAQSAIPYDLTGSGAYVSLGQRLETAYYDIEAVRPLRLVTLRLPDEYPPFQTWTPVSSWWYPLVGERIQPYLHPAAYGRGRQTGSRLSDPPPHFTPAARAALGPRFLYVCSRVDDLDPLNAKAQIDSAVYASAYLTPKIGAQPQGEWDGAKALAGTEGMAADGLLKRLGFPGVLGQINRSVRFGLSDDGSYCPGAVDWFVISGNGCDRPKSAVRRALAGGVTVTGGAARGYRGCPHTTTHAWWDADVFYRFLLGGYDLGEAWLVSRYKLQWCTSFFGDPLYHPDLRKTRCDRMPPKVARAEDITVTVRAGGDGTLRAAIGATLQTTPENPEVAQAVVKYWKKDQPQEMKTAVELRYRGRPCVFLDELGPDTTYCYSLALTDPYQNAFDSRKAFGLLTFRTPAAK